MRARPVLFVSLIVFCGCDQGPAAPLDGSSGADGSIDAAGTDARVSSDPCASGSGAAAARGAGCNGGILGADREDNIFGGQCTQIAMNPAGTCTEPNAYCWGRAGERNGICLVRCTPSGSTYVSTGDCPQGSRCFNFDENDLCFPDCRDDSNCSTHDCDNEGSCVGPACGTNASCANPTPLCIDDACVACARDDQCSAASGGVACSSGSCVECTMDAHCPGQFCVGGICIDCATDTHCNGQHCDIGVAGDPRDNACFPCLMDAHCTDPSAPYCVDHACVPCSSNPSMCMGETPVCGAAGDATGRCVECESSATHCSAGEPICDANACRMCTGSPECQVRDSSSPICVTDGANPLVGQCVECLDAATDCSGAAPICEAGACRGCTDHPECVARDAAFPSCVPYPGDPLEGRCICSADSCPAATPICEGFTSCRACTDSAECATRDSANPICITDAGDPRVGECVGCFLDTDCPTGNWCSSSMCVACSEAGPCGAGERCESQCGAGSFCGAGSVCTPI